MSNILLKVTGNADDAKEVLDSTIVDVKEFGKQTATADLRVDAEQAKRDIAEVIAEMKAVPKEETIRIRVAAEQSKLQALLARKSGLENQLQNAAQAGEETDPLVRRLGSVSSQIESTRGRLTSLASEFEQLGQSGEKDVSKLTKGITALTGGLTKARTGAVSFVSSLVGKVPLVGGLFSKITEAVGQLATTLIPEAAQGFGGLVASAMGLVGVAPLLALIVAAMAALIVSIGQALIGIVALGVAFLVVLGPIIALLGVVLVKIKDIVTGQVALKQANANLKSAIDAQKSAVTQLHQAEVTQSVTRIAAIQAQRQALLQLQDAQNGVNDAKLGIQSAQIQLEQARLTLLKFKQGLAGMGTTPGDLLGKSQDVSVSGNLGQTQQGSSPLAWLSMLLQYKQDILDVKTAAQGTVDSVSALKDATNTQLTAQETWAQYLKRGLEGYQPYMQAVNAVVTANLNLKRADDQLRSAELAKTLAIRHGAAEAPAFESAWHKLKKSLSVIFGPAEAAVFKGIERSMGILAGHGKTLTPAFTKLGIAIGNAFVWWAQMMSKPGNVRLVAGLIGDAAKFVKTMSHWLGEVFKWLVIIAEAAMPSLLGMVKHWTTELGGTKDKTQGIHDFIVKCIGKATTFWHGILQIGGAVVKLQGFFKTLLGIVNPLVKALSKIVELYQTIAATQAAQRQGANAGAQALTGTGALIAKDEALLKGHISGRLRQFLEAQLRNLASQVSSITVGSGALQVAGTSLLQHGMANPQIANHAPGPPRPIYVTQHMPVQNVGNPDHFARVMKKNLQGLGGGVN